MGFTSAQLTNGGRTAHYQISYDETFSAADGWVRAAQLMENCEDDFQLMQDWFSGVNFEFSFPINVQIVNATGGASWNDPPNISLPFGYSPTVTINPGTGTSSKFVRYLLVSEVTEMFMASQNKGWYQGASLFHGADEGSKGEGLSRFLGFQLTLARAFNERYAGFEVVRIWLNAAGRPNFVDNNPDDNQPDITTGCTTCFLYYLHNQLGFSINAIIAAGDATLGAVYRNLTGKNDGWQSFISLVNTFYPPGITYNPNGDAIFPVARLANLGTAQILSGESLNDRILSLDGTALAEVVVSLASDNPTVLTVPRQITLQPGTWSAGINLAAAAITGPVQTVAIHATYAGTRLSSAVQILPRQSVLEGQVTDSALHPLADATVFLSADAPITSESGNTLQLSTDANGFYKTPAIAPQLYQVQAIQSEFVPAQASVSVNVGVPFTTQNFVLVASKPFTINGDVSSQAGAPLMGATVTLDIGSPVPGRSQVITAANGGYTISNDPGSYNGAYTLTAAMAGFMSSSVTLTIPNGATLIERFVLAPLGSLSGTVSDTHGTPIAGATVTAGTVSGYSGPTGAYSLASLDPGPTAVATTAPGFDPAQTQVMVAPGAHVVLNIALTAASATVTGTVTTDDDGSPVIHASVVVVGSAATQTDNTGSYTVSHVPAGDHDVMASDNRFRPQTAPIHVIAQQTLRQDFALESLHPMPPRGPGGQPM